MVVSGVACVAAEAAACVAAEAAACAVAEAATGNREAKQEERNGGKRDDAYKR